MLNLKPKQASLFKPSELLSSETALAALRHIQASGKLPDSTDGLSPDELFYLRTEAAVRGSIYEGKPEDDTSEISPWVRKFCSCMGHLFVAPSLALEEITVLETGANSESIKLRLKSWQMHLLLLTGHEDEGIRLRDDLLTKTQTNSAWKAEFLTLLALSYYSTSESKTSVELHKRALAFIDKNPEIYFKTFGASMAERAALKAGDPISFQYFAEVLDAALLARPDPRYALRQHGYRALVLTQLGETMSADRHWRAGDRLLHEVDAGRPSMERVQFLTLRALAASLLGDSGNASRAYLLGMDELRQMDAFDALGAELDICRIMAPIANPLRRSVNVEKVVLDIEAAMMQLDQRDSSTENVFVRECYMEAIGFCELMLMGELYYYAEEIESRRKPGRDKWKTLTLTILDSLQEAQSFASKIDYFRLIPKFMNFLEGEGLTDQGIETSLAKTIGFTPKLNDGTFEVPLSVGILGENSEMGSLLKFASTLRTLANKSTEHAKYEASLTAAKMIAHDLKRPTDSIGSLLKTLHITFKSQIDSDPAVSAAFNQTLRYQNRMGSLLRDFAKPDPELAKDYASVRGIIEDCILSLDRAEYPEVSFETSIDRLPRVLMDALKMERAIYNIIENAAQALGADGGKIKIRGSVNESNRVVIEISNPTVIPEEILPQIFHRYFTDRKPKGTGMGLAITKQIVEAHGGEVSCESSKEGGTVFRIEI